MAEKIEKYLRTWWDIMARPIYFYTFMPKDVWHGDSMTFLGGTAWILSFALTITIFVIQYLNIGLYLVEELTLWQRLLTLPVTAAFAFAFFTMTLLIVGGFVLGATLAALFVLGSVLYFSFKLFGGKGSYFETIKASFYSGASFLFAVFPIFFLILAKYRLVEFWQVLAAENLSYWIASLYVYGLWSIAGRKVHDVPRWKAFLAAAVPLLIVLIFGMVFHSKIFPKIGKFIM